MYRKLASAVLVAAAINAQYASALGLGEMTMRSALNQPLDAEISLTNVGDLDNTQVLVNLASQGAFDKAGVERTFYLTAIKFEVVIDENGESFIKLRSDKSIKEPFLDFLLEAKWPSGRVIKAYTALIDLPVYTESAPTAVNIGKPQPQSAPQVEEVAAVEVSTVDVRNNGGASQDAAADEVYSESESHTSYTSNTYTIQRGDTMYQVAKRLLPSSDVSVEQTMLAIQQQNPHAFIAGNVNRIKAGEIIRVPSDADVRSVSAGAASSTISTQNKQWQQAQLEAGDSHYTSKRPTDDGSGHLSLASAGTGLANGSDVDGEQGGASGVLDAASSEQLEVVRLENEELEERVQSLDGQIEDLKRMIELKDAELASLQQQMAKTEDPAALAVAEETVQDVEAVEPEVVAEAEADVSEANSSEAMAAVGDDELVSEQGVTEQVEVAVEEVEAVVDEPVMPEPAKPAEKDIVTTLLENPIYIGVAGLIIAFVVVLLLMRRRSAAEQRSIDELANFEFDEDEQEQQSADEVLGLNIEEPADEAMVDAEQVEVEAAFEDFSEEVEEAAGPTTMQTGDAIGEADIYIAYGRYDQAVELLESAIANAPEDVALRSKLVEVHIESNNKEGFQTQFVSLQGLGDEDAIIHAKEALTSAGDKSDWLENLDMAVVEDVNDFSSDLTETIDDLESLDAELSLDDVDLDLGFDDVAEEPSVDVGSQDTIELDALSDDDLADFDLSTDFESELDTGIAEDDSSDNEFDLDAGLDEDLSLDLSDVAETELDVTTNQSAGDEDLSLDFDLSTDLDAAEEVSVEEQSEETEFDLDLGEDLDFTAEESADDSLDLDFAAEGAADDSLDLDFTAEESADNSLDLDFTAEESLDSIDTPAQEVALESAEEPSALSALEGDDLAFLTDADEVSTKLDLARAYVDMGDVDGARDILMEVMKEGNEAQKSEATALIDGLD